MGKQRAEKKGPRAEMDNLNKNLSDVDYIESSVDMDSSLSDKGTTDFDLDSKSLIVRKCSTGLELPPKVNLYSENILKEEETTDQVDRGSIADLAAIKKHWEERFETEEAEKTPVKKAQRVVRHWSVKLSNIPGKPNRTNESTPEVVNRNLEDMTAINDDYNENESAIEREIRWAMEREEMLRQEQEQRQLLREKMALQQQEQQHSGVQTQQIIEHYENTDKEKFKPTYHEMTEADLGHEISKKEAIKEQEMRQQKELVLQNGESMTSQNSEDTLTPTPAHYRETVVQMEIRLQRERDAQFREQQKLLNVTKVENEPATITTTDVNDLIVDDNENCSAPASVPVPVPVPTPIPEKKAVPYRHVGESKIARELEEARAREEEFRRRLSETERRKSESSFLNGDKRKGSVDDDLASSVKSLDLEESAMSVSSESDSAAATTAVSKTNTFTNETPIEREIRLAREREEEYRRQKGFPTSDKPTAQRSVEAKTDISRLPKYNLKNKPVKGDTMKKIAASRLQQEIKQERNREVTLRESGRINTTSDETVGEQMKYKEIAEGPVKRNFVTIKKSSAVKSESSSTESQMSNTDSTAKSGDHSPKQNVPNYVIRTPKITTIFSFREARSNAGSMIEKELKEMREREAELKKQREHQQNKANNNENSE